MVGPSDIMKVVRSNRPKRWCMNVPTLHNQTECFSFFSFRDFSLHSSVLGIWHHLHDIIRYKWPSFNKIKEPLLWNNSEFWYGLDLEVTMAELRQLTIISLCQPTTWYEGMRHLYCQTDWWYLGKRAARILLDLGALLTQPAPLWTVYRESWLTVGYQYTTVC